MLQPFDLISDFKLSGDQPTAVEQLTDGLNSNKRDQVLLGVTGSGKTFSMANIIARVNRPALIMAPNKTLAAQLYEEMKEFFPNNAVEYFVSYYDYYQPEAYIARTDTYIEKDSSINAQLDMYRHSATRALIERRDVVIISSVSCIYGIGSYESYSKAVLELKAGSSIKRSELLSELVLLQYERNEIELDRGKFRVRGDAIDIAPAHLSDRAWKLEFDGDKITSITEFDSLTNVRIKKLDTIKLYGNSHYITPQPTLEKAIAGIKLELQDRFDDLQAQQKYIEAHRLKQKTEYDIEMIMETGSCKGIENYSRYLTGRKPGENPPTLFEYLPKDALLFVDESHVAVPQIGGMYNGDRSRKSNLVEYGFRLPSALDNRPLKFEEWDQLRPQTIYVSATPGKYELTMTNNKYVEQIIRPTGLMDPICEIRPTLHQIDDVINEIQKTIKAGYRILVTTLTKKMAEKLSEHLCEIDIKVAYLHSEVQTLDRVDIIRKLRKGEIDVIVGINLLREGLDIPECGLIAILDADKEGFLRSRTSLIQTIGRVARNVDGRAILYADKITDSIKAAMDETERRRKIQVEYNTKHGITPTSIKKSLSNVLSSVYEQDSLLVSIQQERKNETFKDTRKIEKQIKQIKKQMIEAAKNLEFEKAIQLRNEVRELEKLLIE